jgi:hypothetical protein
VLGVDGTGHYSNSQSSRFFQPIFKKQSHAMTSSFIYQDLSSHIPFVILRSFDFF